MRSPALLTVVCLAVLAACSSPAPASSEPAVGEPLCDYRITEQDAAVFAPCSEGERFAEVMRQLGYPDNADVYMPDVAVETCALKAAGQPLRAAGRSGPDLQRAYRQAEVAARCPDKP